VLALFKAIGLSTALTLLVALFVGSAGAGGGPAEVFAFTVEGTRLYWSWALFCMGTALAWALLAMLEA
jgi:hypothetical protein